MKRTLPPTATTTTNRHTLWVISEEQQDYLLEEETRPELDIEPDEARGLLRFYSACHYEQGVVSESELDYLGDQALASMGWERNFVLDEREAGGDYNQGTSYVFDHERFRITPQQLLKYRRSWFELPVRRIVTLGSSGSHGGRVWSASSLVDGEEDEEGDSCVPPIESK